MSSEIPTSESGAKRKRGEEQAESSSAKKGSRPAASTESKAGVVASHVLKKTATVIQRVVFALRQLGVSSSSAAIVKACSVHCEYDDAAKIRKAIKAGMANGTLQVSAASSGKVWIAGEAEPEGEKPVQVTIEEGRAGTGPACKAGDFVSINYDLFLAGPQVQSVSGLEGAPPVESATSPTTTTARTASTSAAANKITRSGARVETGKAFTFRQAAGDVIKGMDAGVLGLCLGGTRTVLIPWQLGYGKRGSGPSIPPCADLVFDIKLVSLS